MNKKTNPSPFFGNFRCPLAFQILAISICILTLRPASAEIDQVELERVYRGWVSAMINKNYHLWKAHTAAHRQVITHNIVVSRKELWPNAMFDLPLKHPEVSTLTYVGALENGSTAHLIYFGKVDFGLLPSEIPDNLLILKFANEETGWKYDSTSFYNLRENPEILNQARIRDFTFIHQEEFQPSPEIPATPRKMQSPDYVGELWLAAVGYEVTVQVADLHETTVANNVVTDLVIGGLSEAGHKVDVTIKKLEIPEEVPRRLEIGIYALRRGVPATRVWYYKPELDEIPESYSSKVFANAVTLRQR